MCVSFWLSGFTKDRAVMVSHYSDVTMSTMASEFSAVLISLLGRLFKQRNHQSSASLAFMRAIHRRPVDSPHKGPVMWKMFPFDGVIMNFIVLDGTGGFHKGKLRCHQCPVDSPHIGPEMWSFNIFFAVTLNDPLKTRWSFWWFETLWRSYDVTVMMILRMLSAKVGFRIEFSYCNHLHISHTLVCVTWPCKYGVLCIHITMNRQR